MLFITHRVEEAVHLGNRVVVMSRRPGRIKTEITIPRDAAWRGKQIEDASNYSDFNDVRRQIWELVRSEIVRE